MLKQYEFDQSWYPEDEFQLFDLRIMEEDI